MSCWVGSKKAVVDLACVVPLLWVWTVHVTTAARAKSCGWLVFCSCLLVVWSHHGVVTAGAFFGDVEAVRDIFQEGFDAVRDAAA